ncbi:MAG: hypothetical protein JOY56_01385 [Solirubrobacterales bacterium]|nr:hypothetical protein [Solirubrobacterales bacterium]MBV8946039.1 hypothetical protein [Solirubrobacterales bacterium]MBV9363158.1 hypothetical protein [Solirubrobacterales bacterium]MBV9806996.1 hypothetical protein [Solirubrobacterales bacterium]
MRNQWLAIDVATAPAQRARELRRAWERFIGEGEPHSVRAPIADSWRRSAAAGVDPSGVRIAPVVADTDETSARWEVHPLAQMAPLIRACLAATADESRHLIVVSDEGGTLLWVEGNARVRLRAADSMNFAEGTLWSEAGAGTNAIGTAIAAKHAVQVFASEHFNEIVHAWTCAAAPVHDPDSGRLIGVIDLTGEMETVHPHSMAVATATVQALEAQLRCRMRDEDNRLLARYSDRLTAGSQPRALLTPSGRVIASQPDGWLGAPRLPLPAGGGRLPLSGGALLYAEVLGCDEAYVVRADRSPRPAPIRRAVSLHLLGRDSGEAEIAGRAVSLRLRHSEILALLCAEPGGLSSDQLSTELYGDAARAGGVRVEISRLRKLLGDCIEPERYRLSPAVSSDLARIWGLLHRGEVREAATRYRGPLLPRSRAPGVVRRREALEHWLRQSVMTAGDEDALWAWLQTASGARDGPAWRRLLSSLAFHDPRRSLAASRIAELRAQRGTLRPSTSL